MEKKKNRRSRGALLIAITFIAVISSLFFLTYSIFKGNVADADPVTKTVNREVTKKAVEAVIKEETGADLSIDKAKEKMAPEDAEEVDSLINKYADQGILSEALDVYRENGGDVYSTALSMRDKVSVTDMAKLYELYSKYGDELLKDATLKVSGNSAE